MLKGRLIWSNLVRVFVVSLFLIAATVLRGKESAVFDEKALEKLIVLLLATYLFSVFSLILIKTHDRLSTFFAYLQIIWDVVFVTVLILLTGGISSPFSFLFILSIISASILLSRREAIYTASLCGILYGCIVDLQYYSILTPIGLFPVRTYSNHYIFYAVFINIVAYYLTAFLTGYLAERVTTTEHALKEKVIDFEEVERLNTSIVSHLESGLLTLNNEGRIRVFNRYAEQLTGFSQAEAYDKTLDEVIPAFTNYSGDLSSVKRGELEFITESDEVIILGFNSAPLTDKNGDRVGIIINFQDLTHVKRIEGQLKRSDRLAAIGALSARIAHEIRNPLASVSASVQLIAQREGIDQQDQRLLSIVLRETDRLNRLINDFLLYARPNQPVKEPLFLKDLLADLLSLIVSDSRFANIDIAHHCNDHLVILVDPNQIKQVLWNMLVNSSEALPKGGTIQINAVHQRGQNPVFLGGSIKITIVDDGEGISADDLKKIFEPFYTTKNGGTGLGLATVYRIIEAHGGTIYVDSTIGKGTKFTIYLPATGNAM